MRALRLHFSRRTHRGSALLPIERADRIVHASGRELLPRTLGNQGRRQHPLGQRRSPPRQTGCGNSVSTRRIFSRTTSCCQSSPKSYSYVMKSPSDMSTLPSCVLLSSISQIPRIHPIPAHDGIAAASTSGFDGVPRRFVGPRRTSIARFSLPLSAIKRARICSVSPEKSFAEYVSGSGGCSRANAHCTSRLNPVFLDQ